MMLVQVNRKHSLAVYNRDVLHGHTKAQFDQSAEYCRHQGVGARKGLTKARKGDPARASSKISHTAQSLVQLREL